MYPRQSENTANENIMLGKHSWKKHLYRETQLDDAFVRKTQLEETFVRKTQLEDAFVRKTQLEETFV